MIPFFILPLTPCLVSVSSACISQRRLSINMKKISVSTKIQPQFRFSSYFDNCILNEANFPWNWLFFGRYSKAKLLLQNPGKINFGWFSTQHIIINFPVGNRPLCLTLWTWLFSVTVFYTWMNWSRALFACHKMTKSSTSVVELEGQIFEIHRVWHSFIDFFALIRDLVRAIKSWQNIFHVLAKGVERLEAACTSLLCINSFWFWTLKVIGFINSIIFQPFQLKRIFGIFEYFDIGVFGT